MPAALAHALQEEPTIVRLQIALRGDNAYEAGAECREGNHDDLVLALAVR